jgi:hypothetical protein
MQQTVAYGIGNPAGDPSTQPAAYQALLQPSSLVGAPIMRPKVIEKFHRCKAIGIGTTLIVAAVFGFIFNTIDIVLTTNHINSPGHTGHGFWVGAVVMVVGAFGIAAGARRTRGLIQTFNVLCIVGASLTSGQFIISVIGALILDGNSCYYPNDEEPYMYQYRSCPRAAMVMEVLLALLAVVEAIVAIFGSVMCCKTACCCTSCCDNTPIAQTLMVNDVPMTVIYQPQNRTIAVSCAAVPVQGANSQQMPIHQAQHFASPPAYSAHQQVVMSSDHLQHQFGAAAAGPSFGQQQVADNYVQEKRELV